MLSSESLRGELNAPIYPFMGRPRVRAVQLVPLPFMGRPRVRVRLAFDEPPAFRGTYRVRKPSVLTIPGPPAKRRGRAPSYIPDPWSDIEWESHPAAQTAVREHPAGMTLEEIGACMNITRERVRQIEHTALRKLRENSGSDITWIGKLTVAIQDCVRCGDNFVRGTGRQTMCAPCDATRKRSRPRPPLSVSLH